MKDKSEKKRARKEEKGGKKDSAPAWSANVKGCMERGFGMTYEDFEDLDTPDKTTSSMWWGALWITGVKVEKMIAFIDHYPGYIFVENIDKDTVLIKLKMATKPVIINEGVAPCITSQAEVTPCPQGKSWYHLQHQYDRTPIRTRVDQVYDMFPDAKIYLVRTLWPNLELLYMMCQEEFSKLYGRTQSKKKAPKESVSISEKKEEEKPLPLPLHQPSTKFNRLDYTLLYLDLEERNEHEGETWHFYVCYNPRLIEEDTLGKLMELVEGQGGWSINNYDMTKSDVQVLVDNARGGYMKDRQFKGGLCAGEARAILDCPKCYTSLCKDWYKGTFDFECTHADEDAGGASPEID